MLGKIGGKRKRGQQRIRWLDSITDSMPVHLSKLWEILEDRGAWHAELSGVANSWTGLSDRTASQTLSTHLGIQTPILKVDSSAEHLS